MIETLRFAMLALLVLSLTAMTQGSHAASIEEGKGGESPQDSSEKSRSSGTTDSIASLLSTYEVVADSCYVFLQPKPQSYYFGPLLRAERIRWLDSRGDWIQAWIPRLRISGWVRNTQIREVLETDHGTVRIPENLLTKVNVMTKRANVREGATTGSRVIFVATKNQEFWLLSEKEGWYQIWLSDLSRKGWISGKHIVKRPKI